MREITSPPTETLALVTRWITTRIFVDLMRERGRQNWRPPHDCAIYSTQPLARERPWLRRLPLALGARTASDVISELVVN